MDTKTSLFSRARPKVALPKTKKFWSFLILPGEIRNRIYQYYFQDWFRFEFVGEGCDLTTANPKSIKLLSVGRQQKPYHVNYFGSTTPDDLLIIRFPRHRKKHNTALCLSASWLQPLCALILVCRQIHVETLSLLYQRTTFVFDAPRRIVNFLRVVPNQNLDNVTKLHLYYTTYGNPSSANDVIWQSKHIESWTRACKMASKDLICLQQLEIDIWINEDAPKFNLRQNWLQPLLQFRRLTKDKDKNGLSGSVSFKQNSCTLQTVAIKIKSQLWMHKFDTNVRLSRACKHLHWLFGQSISRAILGAKKEEAMAEFDAAWNGHYKVWQHHLGFAKTGW